MTDLTATDRRPGVQASEHAHPNGRRTLFALALGSVGVVYGDIGTSPLYAFRESLHAASEAAGVPASREDVLGVLSLILWALILVVSIKYVLIVLRADNKGEGGVLSLMALAERGLGRSAPVILLLGVVGAALFYGDAIITPAVSVLSAVEGLKLVTPALEDFVIPIALVILIALFAVQSRGTARIARFFGPITALWFLAMAAAGASHIVDDLSVFAAFNPAYGFGFLTGNGGASLIVLGSVFLAVTGGEALYADLGHFGYKPIRLAWFGLVFPALALNYLGQGALVLSDPSAADNPFFRLAPDWALIPMVALATMATIIASQAVITGAFSLTRQAIQLGLLPRMGIAHTSETQAGQIYIPRINWLLLAGVIVTILLFENSSNLAAAYGIAVSGTDVVTSCLAFIVIWRSWNWLLPAAILLMTPFLLIDATFLTANALKIPQGGWAPLALGGLLIVLMLTWMRGVRLLAEKARRSEIKLSDMVRRLEKKPPPIVPGTAVFLSGDPDGTPTAFLHNLKHNKVLHERNVILTVLTETTPRVPREARFRYERLSEHFYRVVLTYGFMETPRVTRALTTVTRSQGLDMEMGATSFFLSRRSFVAKANYGMPVWQDRLFIALARRADPVTDYFHLPPDRVIEIGMQIII